MPEYKCSVCGKEFEEEEHKLTNDSEKCILHCEKDDWYEETKDGKDWSSSKNKVKIFWVEVRSIIANRFGDNGYTSINLSNVIFPLFEEKYIDGEDLDTHFQIYDWHHNFFDQNITKEDSPVYIAENICINFSNSTFLDKADFSDYNFDDNVFFDMVVFKDKVTFVNTTFTNVSFKNTTFLEDVSFKKTVIGKEDKSNKYFLDFDSTKFYKQIKIDECTILNGIQFPYDSFVTSLIIKDTKLNFLNLLGSITDIAIKGNDKEINSLYIECNGYRKFFLINTIVKSNFIFEQNNTIGNAKISCLNLRDSTFEGKVKIQQFEIDNADFYNTKFNDLADFYQTKFNTVNFERTSFEDIVVFARSEFEEKVNFKYTTFGGNSIFKMAKFKKGLDLEDTVIHGTMNFIKSDIPDVGSRETARIIKHSFDDINNNIDANKYYETTA